MGRAILVVDDDDAFRDSLCRVLRAEGYTVEAAADGRRAMHLLVAEPPDLVITDILMPERDGLELMAEVKKANPAIKILAMSGRGGFGRLDVLSLARRLGAHATLAKPFDQEQLLAEVEALLRGKT